MYKGINTFEMAEDVLKTIESGENCSANFFNENRKLLSTWCLEPLGNPTLKNVADEITNRIDRMIQAKIICMMYSQGEQQKTYKRRKNTCKVLNIINVIIAVKNLCLKKRVRNTSYHILIRMVI